MMRMIAVMKTGIPISAELGGDYILYCGILMGEETSRQHGMFDTSGGGCAV